jgi:DnaK suppressor protein
MPVKTALPRAYGIRALRLRLLRRREELVNAVHSHMAAARTAVADDDSHGAGSSASVQMQAAEVDMAEAARDAAELAAIDTALTRIELGEYGLCAQCGVVIPQKRLEANPHALHCIACATADEKSGP